MSCNHLLLARRIREVIVCSTMLQLLDNVADCNHDKIVTGAFGCLQQAFQKQLCEMDMVSEARGKFPTFGI